MKREFTLWLIITALSVGLVCSYVENSHLIRLNAANDGAATECERISGLQPNR